MRNGEQAVVALDIIALMDALKIKNAVIAGFDWGARTAAIIAALWPDRCKALVSVSGYLIGSRKSAQAPFPPIAEHAVWYQCYFATDYGRAGYAKYTHDFNKLIWQLSSPKWDFDDATFDRSAASFDNPDHVDIVIHNYRWRLSLARRRSEIRRSGAAACRKVLRSRSPPSPWKATRMVRLHADPSTYRR